VVESNIVGDVRGGDSFSDIYGMKNFMVGFLMGWSVLLVKGTLVQFPQTYGPYNSAVARWLARFLLRRSFVIIARDKESQRVARELVGAHQEVLLSPDVAFSLEPSCPEQIELDPPLSGRVPPGVIGLNVNGLLYNGGYTRRNMFGLNFDYAAFLPKLVEELLAAGPGELWLVPHTYALRGQVENDNEAAEKLRDSLPPVLRKRIRMITAEYDQHELKGIIGQCDFFIGSRMHACIAALSQGVPCVGVAYSRKFFGVFESVEMADWVVDARSASQDEALGRIVALYQQRNRVRFGLMQRADEARQKLIDVFSDMVKGITPNVCVSSSKPVLSVRG
jgi:polysaccharide pyruvyl transferase WcaK-like protein